MGLIKKKLDEFLDIVVRDYEDLVRSNHDKDLHIKSLEERLSYFDDDERFIEPGLYWLHKIQQSE